MSDFLLLLLLLLPVLPAARLTSFSIGKKKRRSGNKRRRYAHVDGPPSVGRGLLRRRRVGGVGESADASSHSRADRVAALRPASAGPSSPAREGSLPLLLHRRGELGQRRRHGGVRRGRRKRRKRHGRLKRKRKTNARVSLSSLSLSPVLQRQRLVFVSVSVVFVVVVVERGVVDIRERRPSS